MNTSSNYNSNFSPIWAKQLYQMVQNEEAALHILEKLITNNCRGMVLAMERACMLQSMAEHLEGNELTELQYLIDSVQGELKELERECWEFMRQKMEHKKNLLDLHETIEAETAKVYDCPPKASE